MEFWYNLSKQILKLYLAVCIKEIHIRGEYKIAPGPKIIVANHANLTDGFVLPFIMQEKLHFLIQSETFDFPILGHILSKAGQIPVVRGRGHEALKIALDRLSEGKVIVIFPEGKLNHGRELHRCRSGAAVLALMSGAPIVPIGFYVPPEDTQMLGARIQRRNARAVWQTRGRCYVQIGKPWSVAQTRDAQLDSDDLRSLTGEIALQIASQVRQARQQAQKERMSPTCAEPKIVNFRLQLFK